MSRIGKQPINVPNGVKVTLEDGVFKAEGPKGKVEQTVSPSVEVAIDDGTIEVKRRDDSGATRAQHGLMRSLLANAVSGVSEGFSKELEIVGVGYRAEMKGREIHFALGYSHPVVYPLPEGIDAEVDKQTAIKVSGADRQQVGQVAAELRGLRRPDAYKGKGIRYKGEQIKLKVGKAGVS